MVLRAHSVCSIIRTPKGKGIRKPFNWGRVMRHELVHILNLDQTDYLCPHWFTEGLAVISDGVIKTGKDEGAKSEEWRYKGKSGNPYQIEHDDLFASIRASKPINEGENGALSTMTAIFGRLCTYSGKMIDWKDALASNVSLQPKVYDFKMDPPVMPNPDGTYAVAVPGMSHVV